MITQAIRRWLRNVFAWWPWKSAPQEAYRQASGPLGVNTSQEGIARSAVERTTPQANITPRLSTIEERPADTISTQKPATNDIARTALPPFLQSPEESAPEPGKDLASSAASSTPTPQQRLEFLRYLVKRGIVNEGSDDL
jgi:hypothetical protein